jgi:hypothetical protein
MRISLYHEHAQLTVTDKPVPRTLLLMKKLCWQSYRPRLGSQSCTSGLEQALIPFHTSVVQQIQVTEQTSKAFRSLNPFPSTSTTPEWSMTETLGHPEGP